MTELNSIQVKEVQGGAWWVLPAVVGFVWGFAASRL